MGHTALSQRILVDIILQELSDYGKALREKERTVYQSMLKTSLKKIGAINYASSIDCWALILLSIILEHEKRIRKNESMAHGCIQEGQQDNLMAKNAGKRHKVREKLHPQGVYRP